MRNQKQHQLPPPPPFRFDLDHSSEPPQQRPIWQIVMVATIAAGVQFGWALQLSLLTPYVQLLGIQHTWSAYTWLCGPISALTSVKEDVHRPENVEVIGEERKGKKKVFFREMTRAVTSLSKPMWILLMVTCLNWIAWFPFLIYDTDWMGREVYGGKLKESDLYAAGVHAGALGLLLNSVVAGVVSLGIEQLARVCGGVKRLWGGVNMILCVCLAMTVVISKVAEGSRGGAADSQQPSAGVKGGAFAVFAVLGIPLSVTFSVPCALASIFSNDSEAGQGLSLGLLNLAIVIPQMFVSLVSGPWDSMFGGGNVPAFIAGAVAAATSGILAFTQLPSPPPDVALTRVSGATMH